MKTGKHAGNITQTTNKNALPEHTHTQVYLNYANQVWWCTYALIFRGSQKFEIELFLNSRPYRPNHFVALFRTDYSRLVSVTTAIRIAVNTFINVYNNMQTADVFLREGSSKRYAVKQA